MKRRGLAALVAVCLGLATAACSDDGGDDGPTAGQAGTSAVAVAAEENEPEDVPQPELAVSALDADAQEVTVGGYIFEIDGTYLLCQETTDTDPPDCAGESIEIGNGEVVDPSIFLGEPGAQYSDGQVVMTGDVVDGVLVIG